MATLSTAARNAALDAIATYIDTATNGGRLVLYTSGYASVLMNAFLVASKPTFSAASGGAAAVDELPRTLTASGTGVAVAYALVGAATPDNVLLSPSTSGVGLVGSGQDIELTNTNIRSGQQIRFSSFQLTLA